MIVDAVGPDARARLSAIMPRMEEYGSEFAGTFANHAPMVLVALAGLGASEARLYDFFEDYRRKTALPPAVAPHGVIDADNWEAGKGDRAREGDLAAFFHREVETLGMEGALRTYLPALTDGVGASALHALMRIAYAILANDRRECGAALGYWAATHFALPAPGGQRARTDDPAELLAMTAAIEALHGTPIHEMLWHNMRATGALPAFAPVIDWLDVSDRTPAKGRAAALALFAGTQEFCALHALTGMHWVRVVMPFTPEPDRLQRHFWQAIAALMPQMGFPALPDREVLEHWRRLPMPEWPDIAAAAARSNDEHDISLTFSAREEDRVDPDPLYRLAAARRVRLVPDYLAGTQPA